MRSPPSWPVRLAVVLGVMLGARRSAAQIEYSAIDRATVRVFAVKGVALVPDGSTSRRVRVLAVTDGGHGSGVLLTRDGVVLTAAHVVADCRLLAVRVPDHPEPYRARLLYIDTERDFAFLSIAGTFADTIPIPETDAEMRVRQPVTAIGYPLDPRRTHPQSSPGIIAGVMPNGELQLGMSLNPGNSGGPLVDEHDALVGIVSARGDPALGVQGIGVAVPLAAIRAAYRERIVGGEALGAARAAVTAADPATARLVDQMVQLGMLGVLREAVRELFDRSRTELAQRMIEALRETRDADVLALAAGYYWDVAAAIMERAGGSMRPEEVQDPAARTSARDHMRYAILLCRHAIRRDANVQLRSPIAQYVARVWGAEPRRRGRAR